MKRRLALQMGALVLSLGRAHLASGASLLKVRVWPAPEYSRITLESDTALVTRHQFVSDPPRLALDIEHLTLNAALKELVAKVRADDPHIAGIRVGQFAPTVVRIVVDLKVPARPQVFALAPVAPYQHRLVLDLYPEREVDPLQALIALHESGDTPSPAQAASAPASAPASSPNPGAQAMVQAEALEALINRHVQAAPPKDAASTPVLIAQKPITTRADAKKIQTLLKLPTA